MTNEVKPIPDGYRNVTAYLVVDGAAAAIDFYKKAFGAVEIMRFPMGPDKIGHAEIEIGDSRIMLADAYPEMGYDAPRSGESVPVLLHLYVAAVDDVVAQAVAAGGKILRPVEDQFYGDRAGMLSDPFGHRWNVATHIEDVSPEEMQKRAAAAHS